MLTTLYREDRIYEQNVTVNIEIREHDVLLMELQTCGSIAMKLAGLTA